MSYRHLQDLKKQYYDPMTRRLRALLSWRRLDLDESTGDRATALGREDETGAVETDEMDVLAPVGIIARPEANVTVEALVGFVGADGDHPVVLNTLDHGRRAIIDAVGLDADETVVYTQQAILKITADGTVEIRSIGGTAVQLATKADVAALKAHFDQHKHAGAFGGTGSAPALTTAPTQNPLGTPIDTAPAPDGTSVLLAE